MFFNAHCKVIINNQTLETVVSVETHNDGNQIGAYCDIVLPLNSRIEYNNDKGQASTSQNQDPQIDYSQVNNGYLTAPTRYLFNTGDHIKITAKYDGYEQVNGVDTEGYLPVFEGFIYDFYETTPIKIKCLDYIYWFNMGTYNISHLNTTFKTILSALVDIVNQNITAWNEDNSTTYPLCSLYEPIFDLNFTDISFSQMSPAAVLEWFKKEVGFNITLLGNKLYCNIASNTTGTVILQTDRNVIQSGLQSTNLKNKGLRKSRGSNSVFLRLKLKCNFIRTNGLKDSFEIGDENGQLREIWVYKVKPGANVTYKGKLVPQNYLDMAQDALTKYRQDRYIGEVETYLYPYCELFWKVKYYDVRYPERNGNYVITSMGQSINENGFHRKLKLAFLDDQT